MSREQRRCGVTRLLVVESGAKARTIQRYLGKDFLVRACRGHVQDLPTEGKEGRKAMWAAADGELPAPEWGYTKGAESIIRKLIADSRKSGVNEVLVATDPDREGEFIAWRLAELLGSLGAVKRVTFNEITKTAIAAALEEAGDVDIGLVEAAMIRRLMDRLIGFRGSRFCRSWNLASMGRVQTPTLGFVVEREREIEAFVPIPYWEVHLTVDGIELRVQFDDDWRDSKGKKRSDRTGDSKNAESAYAAMEAAGSLVLTAASVEGFQKRPRPPFTTDTLLAAAGQRLSWRPARVMRLAQQLYEAGHITYMRTDSTRTSADAREEVRAYIEHEWDASHLGRGVGGGGGGKGVQDAHEAIRPTRPQAREPQGLEREQARLYSLIWARFTASQMSPSQWQRLKLAGEAGGWTAVGKTEWRTFAGWEAAYAGLLKPAAPVSPLADAAVGDTLPFDGCKLVEDATKPPGRYTQHGLVAKMKAEGIGRPSTYAETIRKLLDRKYARDEKGRLYATDAGCTMWEQVAPCYGTTSDGIFSTAFTAGMEVQLDQVEGGKAAAAQAWHEFAERFGALHTAALESKKSRGTPRQLAYLRSLAQQAGKAAEPLLAGKDIEELDGEAVGALIEQLQPLTEDMDVPASEKQVGFIKRLAERAKLDEPAACALVDGESYAALTGGREGTASALINALQERTAGQPRAASPKQVGFIKRLAGRAKLDEAATCALVGAESFATLTGGREGTASALINALQEQLKKG